MNIWTCGCLPCGDERKAWGEKEAHYLRSIDKDRRYWRYRRLTHEQKEEVASATCRQLWPEEWLRRQLKARGLWQ